MASWLVFSFIRAVTTVSVNKGPISLKESITESSLLQRVWKDRSFHAKVHKSSIVVFSGCSKNFETERALEQNVWFLSNALCLDQTEFVQEPQLHPRQLVPLLEDLDPDGLSRPWFAKLLESFRGHQFCSQTEHYQELKHVVLATVDFKNDTE